MLFYVMICNNSVNQNINVVLWYVIVIIKWECVMLKYSEKVLKDYLSTKLRLPKETLDRFYERASRWVI